MIFWLCSLAVLGLFAYNAAHFFLATGTVAERLAAAWGGSMTRFTMLWGGVLSFATMGGQVLLEFTGDPSFAAWVETVKTMIPPEYRFLIPLAIAFLGWLSRNRSMPKTGA